MQANLSHQHLTSTVLMVLPVDFKYNEQTAVDNEFMNMHEDHECPKEIRNQAIEEFEAAVQKIRSHGVNVIVFDKRVSYELKENITPDSVFPNNWISTEPSGEVILYPMFAPNRNAEKKQFRFILEDLLEHFRIERLINFKTPDPELSLEGTGAIIIDRVHRRAYATRSQRANEELFNTWCKQFHYEPVMFNTKSSTGNPYYHTNIVMAIGEKYAVICKESLDPEEADTVLKKLGEGREIIDISYDQTEKGLCGNTLQVKSDVNDDQFIVMSMSAFNGFTDEQKNRLEKYGKIIPVDISTIERIGGGSARCMLAEIFLPKKK